MYISDYAIRRPLVTVVAMVALVIFGLFALFNLDTDEFPEVNPPVVSVAIPYPGASPDNVEREVLAPIEEAITGLSGVDRIQASALDGFGQLVVEFVFQKDPQEATQDIRDAISQIRGDLPPEMEEPILTRFSPNDLPIVSLTLSSATLSAAELTRIADPRVVRELRGVPGVAQANVVGGVERELTVELRPAALQASGVGVGQVVQALQAQNLAVPVGRLAGELDERTIRLQGRLQEPSDFARLIVAESGGRLVRLGEVADVRDGTEEPRSVALFDGRSAVGIDIVKSRGASTTRVSEAVRQRVERVSATLPAGVELRIVRDAGVRVEQSVNDVTRTLFEGLILTVLVVFLFLNSWRSTVITGLALPISLIAAFLAVWAFGFTLNTMSLLGLTLAIGILIDDAIVVRENIVRHVQMGKDHHTASVEGTREIGLAVTATTLSLVAVFVPIGLMGGIAGQWFRPFAVTLACAVLVSLLVAFSLDPMLSAYWAEPDRPEARKSWITRTLDRFNAWFDRQAEGYKRVIGWALDHRLAMVVLAVGSFVVALALPATGLIGGAFFPVDDRSEFTLRVETPPGANLAYTQLKTQEVVALTRARPEVEYTYATIGGSGGTVDVADVYVRLVPRGQRAVSQDELASALRTEAARIAGATVSLTTGGFGDQKQIQLQLRGPEVATLNALAERIAAEVRQVPGAVDVGLSTKGQKPEVDVELDRGLAGTLGISAGQVAQALRPAFAGIKAGTWVDPGGETREVRVRLAPEARTGTADLASLPLSIPGPQGTVTVPLGQVATVRQALGPAQIDRLSGERVISVQANTQDRPLSNVVADIEARLEAVPMPPGYRITQGGETESQAEVFAGILAALGLAVLLMYLILVLQFGSFLDPLAIMISLPLSLIGVMLALLVTGNTLNIMSMIGVILLAGIVAKNAILLLDFAKWGRERGMGRREALIEAGAIRLRPIVMTSMTLIAGMLPTAIGFGEGGQFRAPLGIAIIGGVITSTLLTLLVIPTIYEILDEWKEALLGRLRRMSNRRAAATLAIGPEPARGAGD